MATPRDAERPKAAAANGRKLPEWLALACTVALAGIPFGIGALGFKGLLPADDFMGSIDNELTRPAEPGEDDR